jgi:uncharacterized protein (DUF169 family)
MLLSIVTVGALLGQVTGRRVGMLAVKQGPTCFGPLAERCLAGNVTIHIDRMFQLDRVSQALAYVGEGRALGKVVVAPS